LGAELPAVTHPAEAVEQGAATAGEERALSVFGTFRNDTDHAIDGIGPPQGRPRATDDFDAIDVVHKGVLHIPKNAGEQGRIKVPSIHHDEQFVGQRIIESASGDRPLPGVDLSDLEIRGQPQSFRNAGGAGAPDVSWVITWMAEGVVKSGSGRLAVEVTSRFINSSRLMRLSSVGLLSNSVSTARPWMIDPMSKRNDTFREKELQRAPVSKGRSE